MRPAALERAGEKRGMGGSPVRQSNDLHKLSAVCAVAEQSMSDAAEEARTGRRFAATARRQKKGTNRWAVCNLEQGRHAAKGEVTTWRRRLSILGGVCAWKQLGRPQDQAHQFSSGTSTPGRIVAWRLGTVRRLNGGGDQVATCSWSRQSPNPSPGCDSF